METIILNMKYFKNMTEKEAAIWVRKVFLDEILKNTKKSLNIFEYKNIQNNNLFVKDCVVSLN